MSALLFVSVLSGLLFASVTWFATSRYYRHRFREERRELAGGHAYLVLGRRVSR